jgi:hypothetical protein
MQARREDPQSMLGTKCRTFGARRGPLRSAAEQRRTRGARVDGGVSVDLVPGPVTKARVARELRCAHCAGERFLCCTRVPDRRHRERSFRGYRMPADTVAPLKLVGLYQFSRMTDRCQSRRTMNPVARWVYPKQQRYSTILSALCLAIAAR